MEDVLGEIQELEGGEDIELNPLLTPKTQRPRPRLMTGICEGVSSALWIYKT